ncbi:hypothetical protein [Jeotgalibacillus terrae]|uniref:Uncharacterized protein n=1 Tax=Jeotgalibacillus terrae TaxID=587735 RepID=A0ABW5ZIY2_9BACL|nr:hypothetical protein [Jeotgalibacillus terrae]MBM7578690.1 hypothetical protein [Jeotgalibacillus terrae]
MQIKPTDIQLKEWADTHVPPQDFFFLDEVVLEKLKGHLLAVKLYTRKEFFSNSDYNTIQLNNSYMYWALEKGVSSVIVADPLWLNSLPDQIKAKLLECQLHNRKGLIFPEEMFPSINFIPEEHIFHVQNKRYVVIQKALWSSFGEEVRKDVMMNYAQLWDAWQADPLPSNSPTHLKNYANRFSDQHGANCLAAAIYSATGDETVIHTWMKQDQFAEALNKSEYKLTHDGQLAEDIVTWVDEQDVIQHAAFYLGDSLYFNKNGQTCFNPWKIVRDDELEREWGAFNRRVYRR